VADAVRRDRAVRRGGTGEFFSLAPREFRKVIEVASHTCSGKVPIIAGTGAGNALAIEFAREAESAGASGLLLLPHYLTEANQAGLAAHVRAVCHAVKIGVIVYNRGACRLQPSTLEGLAADCPNLVGFKDGIGDIELMVSIRRRLGDRFAYLGGLPTAEVFAPAYRAMGVPVYSSAVFNFIPATAMRFYRRWSPAITRPSTDCSTSSSCRTSRSATAARVTR
jgi:5-dehydro-4-deoxyglucarate dehydratase